MKFITLTDKDNLRLLINPAAITVIAVNTSNKQGNSRVYTLVNDSWLVKQTVDEIERLIEKSNQIKLTTYETGPR